MAGDNILKSSAADYNPDLRRFEKKRGNWLLSTSFFQDASKQHCIGSLITKNSFLGHCMTIFFGQIMQTGIFAGWSDHSTYSQISTYVINLPSPQPNQISKLIIAIPLPTYKPQPMIFSLPIFIGHNPLSCEAVSLFQIKQHSRLTDNSSDLT